MDIAAIAEAVAALVGGGAVQGLSGQAAVELVAGIRERIRHAFGRDHAALEALDRAGGPSPQPAELAALAAALRRHAEQDQQFAAELGRWATMSGPVVVQNVHAQRDAYVSGRDQTIVNHNSNGS